LKPEKLDGFYCKCFSILKPEKLGPVWNAGISQESYRNFIGISSISQEKRRNGEKIPHSKQALRWVLHFYCKCFIVVLE